MPISEDAVVVHTGSFVTMGSPFPTGQAVAARAGRVVAVGSLDGARRAPGDEPIALDETFADLTVLAGFSTSTCVRPGRTPTSSSRGSAGHRRVDDDE